jgi:glucose-1-phosphate adenylyltransferase
LARKGRDWYKGTADAVYQNLEYIEEQGAELVLILSGDHIYKMDYSDMLKFHEETKADVTLAVTGVPKEEMQQFGAVIVDQEGQVTGLKEKVKKPKSDLASMGVYLFKKDILQKCLEEDARISRSKHDFGHDAIPRMIGKYRISAYSFDGYWRDVGTVQAYWEANMELLEMSAPLLFDVNWPIRTPEDERPPAIISETAVTIDSLIANGCVIEGRVEHSVLSPGAMVAEGAVVRDSIIMSDSIIGAHSVIDRSILDKEVVVEAECHIGFGDDFRANRQQPRVLNSGITIVGKKARIPAGIKIGRNCVIYCGVVEDNFPGSEIQSGETIEPKSSRRARKA